MIDQEKNNIVILRLKILRCDYNWIYLKKNTPQKNNNHSVVEVYKAVSEREPLQWFDSASSGWLVRAGLQTSLPSCTFRDVDSLNLAMVIIYTLQTLENTKN